MPIRFYCPYCDKLLSIGRRKAGASITCPGCEGIVGVPGNENEGMGNASMEDQPVPLMPRMESSDPLLTTKQLLIMIGALLGILLVTFLLGLVLGVLF